MTLHVKICGVTRVEDALLAAELGASAIGFVFWPGSPRFIDPYRARRIALIMPPMVVPVGVFVDQSIEYVSGVATLVRLGAVQLHGQESFDFCRAVGHRVIKALGVEPGGQVLPIDRYPAPVTLMLDAHDRTLVGGTGRTIDWALAAKVARTRRMFLSGGLRAENVAQAVAAVRPYGVDVSSGVEAQPGVKDEGKLRGFFKALEPSGVKALPPAAAGRLS